MSEYKDKKCYERMVKARTVLIVSQPFFGCLALHLQLIEINDKAVVDTMAVDGTHLYYHPPFVKTLEDNELQGVLAHETLHCVFKHFSRRGVRDPLRWNWAGDFVINAELLIAGFTLPGKPLTLKSPPGSKGHLYDKQYDGMSTEEIYERMPEPPKIFLKMPGGSGDDGEGGSGQQPKPGDVVIEILPKGADWGGCGGVIDAGMADGKGKADQHTMSEADREWDQQVRTAIGVAKRNNAGTLPAYLKRLVDEMQKPRITWRDQTREFIDEIMKSDYAWSRPNRRFLGRGLTLPGFEPDGLHKMVFCGDTSGSVTAKIMSQYLGEMQGALDEGIVDELIVVYCDAAIHATREYRQGDIIVYDVDGGGGGTDFRPALEWVKEHHPDANCTVYLTDMYPCDWAIPDPGMPMLWAAYLPEPALANINPPFGRVIHVASGD